MYTRAAPGEMYMKAGSSSEVAAPLVAAAGGREKQLQQDFESLLSLAGRAELKLCTWMALAYFFMFTAYLSSQTLASTLPIPPPASGDTAMFIVYITFTFSSFWSPLFVHYIGAKPCIQLGFCMCVTCTSPRVFFYVSNSTGDQGADANAVVAGDRYGTYIAANLYPRTWTLYPGAAMVGLAASPLWVSQGILITHFATLFAEKRGEVDGTAHVGFFNGIFSAFMVMTGVVGNLVSSFVFNGYNGACASGGASATSDSLAGSGGGSAAVVVPQSAVDGLFSIYLLSTALAILTATFTLPSMTTIEEEREKYNLVDDEKVLPSLWMTLRLLVQPRMFLLAPIYGAQGLIGAFLSANFTYEVQILACTVAHFVVPPGPLVVSDDFFNSLRKNVIEPNLGECSVGYVMAANYTASALVSISIGRVSDLLGRPFVMGFAGSCLCCMFVVLKYYPPTTPFMIYGLAVVIGLGLAALRTPLSAQLSANYLDQTEAAFAASEMCSTVAAALGFLFANSVSLDTKLDAAAIMSIVGFTCYFIEAWLRGNEGAEAMLEKRQRQQHTQLLASQRLRAHSVGTRTSHRPSSGGNFGGSE